MPKILPITAKKLRAAPSWYNSRVKSAQGKPYEYTVFFERNEHGGYTVTVPALPGLVTEGKNLEDARDMARDAIRCYIEGLKKANEPVPVEQETAQLKISVIA